MIQCCYDVPSSCRVFSASGFQGATRLSGWRVVVHSGTPNGPLEPLCDSPQSLPTRGQKAGFHRREPCRSSLCLQHIEDEKVSGRMAYGNYAARVAGNSCTSRSLSRAVGVHRLVAACRVERLPDSLSVGYLYAAWRWPRSFVTSPS